MTNRDSESTMRTEKTAMECYFCGWEPGGGEHPCQPAWCTYCKVDVERPQEHFDSKHRCASRP